MQQRVASNGPANDRRALPIVVFGVLVALAPLMLAPFPGGGGPITFIVRLVQGLAVVVGIGVVGAGYRSYRTGKFRFSLAVVLSILSLILVAGIGGLVETSANLFIPIGVWLLAISVVVGLSVVLAFRLTHVDPS
ncbi:hypothetical protein AUR64_16955 [Haloprofundus marisrubri]|uniref:Uncharacterized protein n=1 Tax=Haloprofundus marisrubri TaxID=1514971 RepID=A0A0W1R7T5_9EURY|nr:hypothetical protein AUR64_16955 [Haloprofundus marisrubri]